VDNFRRIIEGKADVAFAQSGTYQVVTDPEHKVSGLAAIYYEPLWIFSRHGIRIEDKIPDRDGSVSVGPKAAARKPSPRPSSRRRADVTSPAIVKLPPPTRGGSSSPASSTSAFFVTSYRDPGIMDLMRRKDLALTSFRREAAYTRKFRGLTPLKLPEGLLDLRDNIPRANVTLLSPSAMLVAREDISPRVVELVLRSPRPCTVRQPH
jgi:hypothetical protein